MSFYESETVDEPAGSGKSLQIAIGQRFYLHVIRFPRRPNVIRPIDYALFVLNQILEVRQAADVQLVLDHRNVQACIVSFSHS